MQPTHTHYEGAPKRDIILLEPGMFGWWCDIACILANMEIGFSEPPKCD